MPEGSGLVIAVVVVVVVVVLIAAAIQGHFAKKATAEELSNFKKDILGYMQEKQEHKDKEDQANATIKPAEPFSPQAVDSYLDRTKEPWPPKSS